MIKKLLYQLFWVSFLSCTFVNAQQGKLDTTFNTFDDGTKGDGFDSAVRTLLLQPNNNLIVGGDFSSLNGISSPSLVRLKPDGTIDESFTVGSGFSGKVYAAYLQLDGKIIVGGGFTSYNAVSSGRLIRLNADGSRDSTFDTSVGAGSGIIYSIAEQSDGKIIIVGSFTKYNNVTVNRIARILPNGSLDRTFATGTGSSTNITNVRILSNGKILITGNFISFNGTLSNRIIRLNSDGSVDNSFNIGSGFNDDVNAIAVQRDGKILLGGNFTLYNGNTANRIIRIYEDGSLDQSFQRLGFNNGSVQIIKEDHLGNIMVGGSFSSRYGNDDVNRAVLLNADGTIKSDFDLGSGPGSASVFALAEDQEGSWFIGGSFAVFDGQNQGGLAKTDSNGEQDTGYLSAGVGFDNSVLKILPLANLKTMVFGNFSKFNNLPVNRITRLLEDGSLDLDFNTGKSGADKLIKAAVVQEGGKIVFGGNFTKYNDAASNRIARILPNGTLDNTFNSGTGFNAQVYALAVQSDNKIIAAGNFTRFNNDLSAARIVRLLPDGSRDVTFNVGTGADAIIEDVLIQPDGKILAAGRFTTFNGQPYPHLVRLNEDGSIDLTFNIGIGFDKHIYALAMQSDGKIIAGGTFLTFKGSSQKRIIRLNPNGSLDDSFSAGTGFSNGDVRCILVQPDDKLLVGGAFSGTYKNSQALRLIRLLKTGDFDNSFDARLNKNLLTLSFTNDYRLLIGGDFNSVNGVSKHRAARLKLCVDSTIWDGFSWTKGYPSSGKEVFFKENFPNLISANICSCTIESAKTVTLLSGNTLGIEFSYSGLGTLVLEDTASLYQSDDSVVNTGIINLFRKTKPILRYDYTFWSSPVDNQKLIDVSPNTLFDKYLSFDTAGGWKEEPRLNNMLLGKGYAIRGPQEFSITSRAVYEAVFKGIPNNGKVEIELGETDSFGLVGNPYPSAIDAAIFLKKNNLKTKGALYFWMHHTPVTNFEYNSDDYAAYNLVGGVNTEASYSGVNEIIPDGKIASGQSFFVISNAFGTIEFNDSMRILGNNNAFFKPSKAGNFPSSNKIEKHRLWLNFENSKGAYKQILIGYMDEATNAYDLNYDAESLDGNQFVDFYSLIDDKKLVIQGRALPFSESDFVALGYSSTIAGEFSIAIDHADGDLSVQTVYLEDKTENIVHNLLESNYKFTTTAGTFLDRFVIRYNIETLGADQFKNQESLLCVSVKGKNIILNSTKDVMKEVSIFDISGKMLFNTKTINNTEYQIVNFKSSDQILLINVVFDSGKSAAQKIVFH